jgi:anti-sigma-K factor RskA
MRSACWLAGNAPPPRSAFARDRAFAALVAAWEERLAPWTAELPEVAPPPQVWERIAAQLSGAQRQRPKFWQSLMFWRGFGIVSALAAASLAVLLYLNVASQQAALVASIEGDGQRIFVAVIDVKRLAIAVVPAAYRPNPTRVPELWLVPPGGKPLPLGVLPSDRPTRIAIPTTFADQARRDAVRRRQRALHTASSSRPLRLRATISPKWKNAA